MNKKTPFFLAIAFYFCYFSATGQVKKDMDNKANQQQEMLLGKRQQEELARQQQQKILLEKQKQQLDEKEKALLRLQYEKKQSELENQKKQQSALLQKNQLQAQYEEALRDKQITTQKAELAYNKRWLIFLGILAALIIIISSIIYVNQRKTKRLNKLIFTQNNELEKINMVKDRVLSVVGHDMRTPLNILLSFTQLLKEGNIPPAKMKGYMEQFELTLNHTSFLMDNLLQWAASQMQGYRPMIHPVLLSKTAADITVLLQSRADKKNIRLVNEIDTGAMVMADENMTALILRNLVSNAVKFTAAGGEVRIGSETKQDAVVISVSDNGIGMSEKQREQFNAPPIQASESTLGTDKEKGIGLGLLLCKTFVKLMNGQITIQENKTGMGCIFEIVLPNGKSSV